MRWVSFRQVLAVAACVMLITAALPGQYQVRAPQDCLALLASPAMAAQPDARGDWWMLGHDARHTGRSAFSGPHAPTLQWKFRSTGPGSGFSTAALGPDGAVYAGCGTNLVALDSTGHERWFLPLQGSASSPVLAADGETFYVTGGQEQLFCVSTDGKVKWSFTVPGGLRYSAPLITGGLVILAGQDSMLHAITAEGKESWTYGVPDHFLEAGPVVDAAGAIYIALSGLGIQELSPAGELLHTYKLSGTSAYEIQLYPDGSFLIRDVDNIYKLTRDGQQVWTCDVSGIYIPADMALRGDGTAFYGDDKGVAHALSAQGRELWRYQSGTRIVATPVLGPDGAVAIVDEQGTLTVLDVNGQPRCAKKLGAGAWFGTPPVFSAGGALFASGGGYLYALAADGAELWKYSGGGTFSATPLLAADGAVYAACTDGRLYVLNPDGTQRRRQQLDGLSMFTPALAADGALLAAAGSKLCAVPPGGGAAWEYDAGCGLGSSLALDTAGMIYLGTEDGRLLALRPEGTLAWAYQTAGQINGSSPAIGQDGMIYFGTALALKPPAMDPDDPKYLPSQQDGKLYALKPDGTLAWTFATGASIWSSPVIADDGTIYVASTSGMWVMGQPQDENAPAPSEKLFAVTPEGKQKWSYPLFETNQGSAALGPDGAVYICSWRRRPPAGEETDAKLYAFSPEGKLLWQGPYGCLGTPCVGADGTVYSSGDDSKLYALTPTGKVRWSYQLGEAVASSPVIAPDGTLYVGCSDGYLYAFRDP